MTDADALHAAILLHPAEDTPRLVYADWLDENAGPCPACVGEWADRIECRTCAGSGTDGRRERAEFIRVQVEAERLDRVVTSGIFTPGPPSNAPDTSKEFSRLCDLRRRERELWPGIRETVFRPALPSTSPTEWCIHADHVGGIVDVFKIVVVRKGFIDEARLTTAAFLGGPCERCQDVSHNYPPHIQSSVFASCASCSGNGRTPGLAAAIFREHPVTRVVLTGKTPYHDERGWFWALYVPEDEPADVWDYELPEWLTDVDHKLASTVWNSEEDAVAAASELCVRYARKVARLPPAVPRG